jgi:hypothetical protein
LFLTPHSEDPFSVPKAGCLLNMGTRRGIELA